jgi:hypothetical protein
MSPTKLRLGSLRQLNFTLRLRLFNSINRKGLILLTVISPFCYKIQQVVDTFWLGVGGRSISKIKPVTLHDPDDVILSE